jgi:2-polyprenyl-3-methyl-5-hydroxy-6-metoxy-1,4-benzoquinol methylase
MQVPNALEKSIAFVQDSRVANSAWTKVRRYPKTPEGMRKWSLYNGAWYYDVELMPDIITKGNHPRTMPHLPRMMLRNCDLDGAECLDIGSMEGLIPVLMCRQGASRVLATDFSFHCYRKMCALMNYYDVEFSFERIGLLYDLASKIAGPRWPGFDLINLSGVLYHVFSPFQVLAGLRPLLKKDGLMIVSTNVVDGDGFAMEFNNSGKFQSEGNTFWYLTIPMFDYMLRYFQLAPIDCLYHKYEPKDAVHRDSSTGYVSVVCRAVDDKGAGFNDTWLSESVSVSWEYLQCNQKMIDGQSRSKIGYRNGDKTIDMLEYLSRSTPVGTPSSSQDTNFLRLADTI